MSFLYILFVFLFDKHPISRIEQLLLDLIYIFYSMRLTEKHKDFFNEEI